MSLYLKSSLSQDLNSDHLAAESSLQLLSVLGKERVTADAETSNVNVCGSEEYR